MNIRKAFTLVELLVILAIIGILVGLIAPLFVKMAEYNADQNAESPIPARMTVEGQQVIDDARGAAVFVSFLKDQTTSQEYILITNYDSGSVSIVAVPPKSNVSAEITDL